MGGVGPGLTMLIGEVDSTIKSILTDLVIKTSTILGTAINQIISDQITDLVP